jgi:type IV pilus assembly protein PilA
MTILKKLTKRGFTLIELMIVVVIIGILASLAIYGVQKYVANSKSAEARMILGRITKDSVGRYEGEAMAGDLLLPGDSVSISHQLCPNAAATIPTTITAVAGRKYQPNPEEWNGAGWQCLGTTVTTPIYYMYNYESDDDGDPDTALVADQGFIATATGDLDGDAVTSLFTMEGNLTTDSVSGLVLVVSPTVKEVTPEE